MIKATKEQALEQLSYLQRQVEFYFSEHPRQTGESYWQHLAFTIKMTSQLLYAAAALLVHGLFPFLCVRTASIQIEKMYLCMITRKPRPTEPDCRDQQGLHI